MGDRPRRRCPRRHLTDLSPARPAHRGQLVPAGLLGPGWFRDHYGAAGGGLHGSGRCGLGAAARAGPRAVWNSHGQATHPLRALPVGRAHLLRAGTRVDRVEGPGHLPVRTGHQPAHLGHWNVGTELRQSAGSRRLHHMGRDPGQPGPGHFQRPAGSSPRRRLRPGRARGPGDRQPQTRSQSGRLGRAGGGRRCRVVVDPAPTRA